MLLQFLYSELPSIAAVDDDPTTVSVDRVSDLVDPTLSVVDTSSAVVEPVPVLAITGARLQYDRDFLLSLANSPDSIRKPADLPQLPDVILDLVNLKQTCIWQDCLHHEF